MGAWNPNFRGENQTYLKPPPSKHTLRIHLPLLKHQTLLFWHQKGELILQVATWHPKPDIPTVLRLPKKCFGLGTWIENSCFLFFLGVSKPLKISGLIWYHSPIPKVGWRKTGKPSWLFNVCLFQKKGCYLRKLDRLPPNLGCRLLPFSLEFWILKNVSRHPGGLANAVGVYTPLPTPTKMQTTQENMLGLM